MKKLLLIIITLCVACMTYGVPLTGIKTIPGTYATIAAAIADLNANGVGAPGVIFNINPFPYTENIVATLSITATGTAAAPIVFQKNPAMFGANPVINVNFLGTNTPGSAVQDGIWNLIGCDYVTINGIDLVDPNVANPATMEYGFGMFKRDATDGCQFNMIKNCVVTLNRINNAGGIGPAVDGSKAINVVNATAAAQTIAVVVTAPAGSNSNNKFYSNTLQNCNIGVALIGYVDVTPFNLADQNNDVGGAAAATGNTIINFGGAPAATNPAAGVRTQNQYGLNVSYNTLNNNTGVGVNHPATMRGIFLQAAVSASAKVNNNTLSITGGSTTSQISVIENVSGSTPAGNTININNNLITNCTWPTATTGIFYGILNSSSALNVNISGNTILNISSPSTGICYMINGGSPQNLSIDNNEIGNITKTVSGTLYAMFAGTAIIKVHHNNVHDLNMMGGGNAIYGFHDILGPANELYYNNSFHHFYNFGTGGVFGLYTNTAAGIRKAYSNTIYNFAANGGGPVYGIFGASSSPSYYKNRIFNLSSGGPAGIVYGIYIVSGSPVNIFNNYISDLKTPNAASATVLSGIYLNFTAALVANVYYNTVHLNGLSTGAPFSSAALFVNTIATVDVRNNILINNSVPTGAGIAAAYRRNSNVLGTYTMTSNNNNFYAGIPSPTHVILYDGVGYQTLVAYKAYVFPRDAVSFTENTSFVSVPTNNFHINCLTPTLCESGAARIIAPIAIQDDYDSDIRWGEAGYIGTGFAPDVGADEFNPCPAGFLIAGTVMDSLGVAPAAENLYIVAHVSCCPEDTIIKKLTGGDITYTVSNNTGTYTLNCQAFMNPPGAGDQVFLTFFNTVTQEHYTGVVDIIQPGQPITNNVVIKLAQRVHLPNRTSSVRVVVPPHKTLQIHYVYVEPGHCGNTDVFVWNGNTWVKFKQWNWNHYCTWRFIQNNTALPMVYVIHNDNGDMKFDLKYNCPNNPPTTPGNNNEYGLINMGWRDRPHLSSEFGNIIATSHTFTDYEGAFLDNFPQIMGDGGVQNLTIQFESYQNNFWNDMNLMIDLQNVTQGGTLTLNIPDATIPVTSAVINPGDTACFFNPGGILIPGVHIMYLSASPGLSLAMDCFNFTSMVPAPFLPTVTTTPVTGITSHSAMSGGSVTADGGAPVTARGICWSTLAEPTILDNITTNGPGLGNYTSMMAPLLPLTTYHVRAYASNFTGTAYGAELVFTTHAAGMITGTIIDSLGIAPPAANMYIVAHTRCNPADTLSNLNGGITYQVAGNAGTYTIDYSAFMNPPVAGEQVFVSFYNTVTMEHNTVMINVLPGPVTNNNVIIRLAIHVHLPFRTSWVRVVVPPHTTLQIHYVYVEPGHCGNTDVIYWNGQRWVKYRQWNWNHAGTWRYIRNNSNSPQVYVIHNDNGDMRFDLMFNCPNNPPTTPGNNNEYALINMGWRDRPNASCEFGNIQATNHVFTDEEGSYLDNFPQIMGDGGVQNLAIQFQSYQNIFWGDMQLMIDLHNVSQGGTLILNIPDATIPQTTAVINPGDTACFFNPGGILTPGMHTMTLSASGGLSMGMDCFNFTSNVIVPPLVVTGAPTNASCFGSADGSVNTTVSGGLPPYSYLWSTGATTSAINGLAAGAYTVSVTDVFSATDVGSWIITQPPDLVLNATMVPANCPGANDGSIDLTVAGGTQPHVYLWSNGATTEDIGNLTPGSYCVTVMDANGCVKTGCYTVGQVSAVCAFLTVNGTVTGTVCYNAIQTILVPGGGNDFTVLQGGNATFIAGHNILYQPATRVRSERASCRERVSSPV